MISNEVTYLMLFCNQSEPYSTSLSSFCSSSLLPYLLEADFKCIYSCCGIFFALLPRLQVFIYVLRHYTSKQFHISERKVTGLSLFCSFPFGLFFIINPVVIHSSTLILFTLSFNCGTILLLFCYWNPLLQYSYTTSGPGTFHFAIFST